jgi:2-C-methyl-D-erythritol 4-phosphate cytidylyltransferase
LGEKKYVIIAAGGYGSRMQTDIPKQFLPLAGIPVIVHTIQSFIKAWDDLVFIVVLPEEEMERWEKIRKKFFKRDHILVTKGGATRFHSVKNGLKLVKEKGIVAVQDACRPFVSKELLMKCLEITLEKGNAVPVIDLKDSLRELVKDASRNRNRARYKAVQTPQCFQLDLLKQAYRQTFLDTFTDDAAVVEAAGHKINLIEGDPANFKITTPFDLKMAERFVSTSP